MKTKIHSKATKFLKSGLALLTATVISLSAINYQDVLATYLMNQLDTSSPTSSLDDGLVGHWTFDGPDVSGSTIGGSATNSGWINPNTGANATGVGTVAWSNPTSATANDGSNATVAGSGAPNWFNTGYGYRKKLTIDETKVGGASNLTNYPILVSFTDANLKTTGNGGRVTNANGYDIIFTNGTNSTQLAHEIESYNATTGEINMWVSIPTLSTSVDTDFYVYYGNSGVSTSQEDAATVWAAYEAVWHLNGVYTDSAKTHDATNSGTTSATGMVSNGVNCADSPAKYMTVPDSGTTLDNATNMTASIWVRPTAAFVNWDHIFTKSTDDADGNPIGWTLGPSTSTDGEPAVGFNNTVGGTGNARSSTAMTTNGSNWYHITSVKTGTDVSIFTNGSEVEEWTQVFSGTPQDTTGKLYICAGANGWSQRFKGDVDEVRIAKSALSAGWIATEYNTITLKGAATGKFIKAPATEETSGAGNITSNYLRASNFGFSIPTDATIDGVEVRFERKTAGTTSTNVVKLVNAAGAVAGNDNSTDPSWTGTDTLETYGGASNLWGLTLTPADINDTDFGFVVSATHDGTTAQNASIDYMQVKVYYTTAGASNLTALDVSGNGKNGTVSLSTVTEGHMGQAFDFDGTTNNYINVGNAGTGVKSVAFWMQADDTTTRNILALSSGIYPNLNVSSQVVATGFTSPTIYVDGVAGTNIPDTGWHHVVITTNTGISASAMEIGRRSTGYFDGKLDDVRIYNRVLTANEITRLANMHTTINATSSGRYSQGLVGHWTFDGSDMTSTTVLDKSGNNSTGTPVNLTLNNNVVPGPLGQALDFGGDDNSSLNLGAPAVLNNAITSQISIAAWVYLNNSNSYNYIISNARDSGSYKGFDFRITATNTPSLKLFDTNSTVHTSGATAALTVGRWHHVVATFDGTTVRHYLDGQPNGTRNDAFTIGSPASFNTYIGAMGYNNNSVYDLQGKLDDVRIYNRAITADEATGLYYMGDSALNSSRTDRISDGIVGHWTFDGSDMSGSTTSGSSTDTGWSNAGTGANVTGVGTVAWSNPGNALTNNSSYATVAGTGAPNWFNSGYGFRKKLTIDKTKVGGTSNLTNYPILVSMTDTALRTTGNGGSVTNANGYDIIFTNGTNSTQLAHEIESYNATTGEINMWVSIPTLSTSVDTDFYIYYGNSGVSTTQEDSATVWAAYEAVLHLNNSLNDSANSHNGTDNNTTSTAGVVGNGRLCSESPTTRFFSLPEDGTKLDNATNMTVSIWARPTKAFISWNKIVAKGAADGSMGYAINATTSIDDEPSVHFYNTTDDNFSSGTARSTVSMTDDGSNWYHIASVKTGTDVSVFTDGIETEAWSQAFSGTPRDTNGNVYICANANGWGNRFDGDVDEVRIAKSALSDGWIATEYNTITSKGTGAGKFIKTVATAETSGSGSVTTNYLRASNLGFSVPAGATINGIQVQFERKTAGTTSTDVVKLVNAAGAVAGNDNSTDPSWTGSDALETYGGAADLWGLTLTPTDVNDTDFGFVVSATHDGTTAQNASVDYMQVKVYYTTAGASNLIARDTSGNGNDGDVNTAVVIEGNLGQAMSFNGTSDYINVGATGQTVKSVSVWLQANDITGKNVLALNSGTYININSSSLVGGTGFTSPTVYIDGVAGNSLPDTGWHHVTITTNTGISASAVELGRRSTSYFNGKLDDVRIYDRVLTAEEIYDLYQLGKP